MVSTTSSAMAWALVTSQLLRLHLSVSVRLMVAVIHSTASFVQRLLQVAGWNQKSWLVLLFSWLQMLLMQ